MRSTRLLAAASLLAVAFAVPACLDRPVVSIQPGSCGLSATRVQVDKVDKVDLLLMVDGSLSMSDKQSELSRRIPALIRALTNPRTDAAGTVVPRVRDLHVAVISSNLGSYGTGACDPALHPGHEDDRAHLLPRVGANGTTENGTTAWYVDADGAAPKSDACPAAIAATPISWGFDASAGARFTGTQGAIDVQKAVSCAVQSVRDDGCGYEAQLEAIYRFLVDPAPPKTQEVACTHDKSGDQCGGTIVATDVDQDLLAQRKAFLRPDSELAIVILTDENDASLRPQGQNWIPWATGGGHMPRGWKACESVPDDVEPDSPADVAKLASDQGCTTCMLGADPAGNCGVPWPAFAKNVDGDQVNLRAFHQVQRFGFNFLFGRQRYVDAFTAQKVRAPDGTMVTNPVFAGGVRTPHEIFVAAIVGVPTRLVESSGAPKPSLSDDEWAKLVSADLGARDPHMIESIAPRAGVPKFAGDPSIDPDNGGDRDVSDGSDLQFACIGKRSVTTATSIDCGAATASSSPLCATSGGAITQPYFKAYPGLRELRVLHDLSKADVPTLAASICTDSYEKIMDQAFASIDAALDQCLASQLTVDPATGSVPCTLVEVFAGDAPDGAARCEDLSHDKGGYCTPGAAPCRATPVDATTAASQLGVQMTVVQADGSTKTEPQQAEADAGGNVYITTSDGKRHLVCELRQLAADPDVSASDKTACQQDPQYAIATGSGGGWCYSTASAVVGANCVKRGAIGKIRFFGDVQPHGGSQVFRICRTGTCG